MKIEMSDILVFRSDNKIKGLKHPTEVTFKNPLPVQIGFTGSIIGQSNLKQIGNDVYADIEIFEQFGLSLFAKESIYPYLGGETGDNFRITSCSLGGTPNKDKNIPKIDPNKVKISK